MSEPSTEVRLTQYARGAGCGCKIAPKALEEILKGQWTTPQAGQLLVGNSSKDDAAVYDLGNGSALISTTDFFMPIVDDPEDFGRIAAANAISDVYAMGGTPIMAVAILGWPVEQLPLEWARHILSGARAVCSEAAIPLAGGHSIDTTEPVFGLAVTGMMPISHLKRNNTIQEGDDLYLTKPLGVGILTTAMKRGLLQMEHVPFMRKHLLALNKCGEALGGIDGVHAMTDVTGFGFLGHLLEMTEGSGFQAEINYDRLPVAEGVRAYIKQRIFPDATTRNWSSYGTQVKFAKGVNVMEAFTLLPDPQTNGGLLFSASPEAREEVRKAMMHCGLEMYMEPIGRISKGLEKPIVIGN
jgi:selenide,water dikinase